MAPKSEKPPEPPLSEKASQPDDDKEKGPMSLMFLTEAGQEEINRLMDAGDPLMQGRIGKMAKENLRLLMPDLAQGIEKLATSAAPRWDYLMTRRFELWYRGGSKPSAEGRPLAERYEMVMHRAWTDAPHAAHVVEILTSLSRESDDFATGLRYATARRIVDDADEPHPDARKAGGAVEALEKELAKRLVELVEALVVDVVTSEDGTKRTQYVCATAPDEEDGMLALDARYVRYLESFKEYGKAIADEVRYARTTLWREVNDPQAWAGWCEKLHALVPVEPTLFDYDAALEKLGRPPIPVRTLEFWHPDDGAPKAVRNLARVLWRDVVGPRLEEAWRKPPSLVRAVHVDTMHFHSRAPRYDEKSSSLTFEGRKLAEHIGATFDIDVIQRGLGLLGSVVSHELFHWEVTQGHEQHLRGVARPHVLNVEGGWVALAERLGLKPAKHATNLRALVIAQAAFHFSFPDGSHGNMLILNERPAVGGRRGNVRIELGSVLMPGYVHGLPPREKKLVPLLRERVPLYGRSNEHGEQRTMSLAIMAEFRDRARELVEDGGVRLSQDDFTSLADRSGLPRKLIVPVRDHWLEGDTRAPAFLKRIERDRYTLSDVHAAERTFLEEGGRDELTGHAAGVKGAANKRAKIRRLGRGKTATKPR